MKRVIRGLLLLSILIISGKYSFSVYASEKESNSLELNPQIIEFNFNDIDFSKVTLTQEGKVSILGSDNDSRKIDLTISTKGRGLTARFIGGGTTLNTSLNVPQDYVASLSPNEYESENAKDYSIIFTLTESSSETSEEVNSTSSVIENKSNVLTHPSQPNKEKIVPNQVNLLRPPRIQKKPFLLLNHLAR